MSPVRGSSLRRRRWGSPAWHNRQIGYIDARDGYVGLGDAIPALFLASCVVAMGAAFAFQRELIDKGYEEGSPWDRRLWAYLRRYDD